MNSRESTENYLGTILTLSLMGDPVRSIPFKKIFDSTEFQCRVYHPLPKEKRRSIDYMG